MGEGLPHVSRGLRDGLSFEPAGSLFASGGNVSTVHEFIWVPSGSYFSGQSGHEVDFSSPRDMNTAVTAGGYLAVNCLFYCSFPLV